MNRDLRDGIRMRLVLLSIIAAASRLRKEESGNVRWRAVEFGGGRRERAVETAPRGGCCRHEVRLRGLELGEEGAGRSAVGSPGVSIYVRSSPYIHVHVNLDGRRWPLTRLRTNAF